jgi:glycolate dehydrogenase FAD-binding subunit
MDAIVKEWSARVHGAQAARRPLRLRGGGTKDFYGQALEGEILDTRAHAGIVAYEPSELVITARCGTPLEEIERALAGRGQMLAFEPPRFAAVEPGGGTFGGMLAAGLSGPRRQQCGAVRDFVLGVRVLDGRGAELRFGGQVMKNVAGYDVSRVMAGALGTLGLVLEASIKTLPLPVAEATLRLEMPEANAIETMNRWAGKPLPVSATAFAGGQLAVRLSGAAAAVKAACAKIGGERLGVSDASALWTALRDHAAPFFEARHGGTPLWRIAVPPATPPLGVPGELTLEWGGGLRWLVTRADARTVRDAARAAGGHATLFRYGEKSVGVFQPLEPAVAAIHRRLKQEFDPAGIFNPGRMYPDL